MNIREIKEIPIADLLAHLGHRPVSALRGGTQLMYLSPLRSESTASFSVSTTQNLWHDYGTGKGGSIIDLAMEMRGGCALHDAVLWLEEQYQQFSGRTVTDSSRSMVFRQPSPPRVLDMTDMTVEELTHPALLSYLMSRGIPVNIAVRHCREVHYRLNGREYFGIAFRNILGGIEIRNPFFKGCYGPKAPTIIKASKESRTEDCCVFEGFMDLLSYMAMREDPRDRYEGIIRREPTDCIVLNSTSIIGKAMPFIGVYDRVWCYLDNDQAGRNTCQAIMDAMPGRTEDMSAAFAPHKDLNEYLSRKGRG